MYYTEVVLINQSYVIIHMACFKKLHVTRYLFVWLVMINQYFMNFFNKILVVDEKVPFGVTFDSIYIFFYHS